MKDSKDYKDKIPSLPYKKETASKPVDKGHCDANTSKQPEPFDGLKKRQAKPERQHFPFLTIDIDFLGQWNAVKHGGDILVSVTNNGNGVAFTPIIELIESAPNGLFVNPPDPSLFARRGYLMLPPLYPRQTKIAPVMWHRTRSAGRIIGICYDPILDARPKVPYKPWNLPEFHRKITSIHWSRI